MVLWGYMKRKLLIFLGIITVFMGVVGGERAYAKRTDDGKAGGTDATKCDVEVLGFNAWWNGLGNYMDDQCNFIGDEDIGKNLAPFVWTIVLNVLHDIFAAIGYISIALITFGGYMYITSSGDPGKATKARKTLTSAVIGLVLVLLANVIVDSVIGAIGLGTCEKFGATLANCDQNSNKIIKNIFDKALSAGGIMAVGFIVYGGISYITSNGSPDKARKALRTLIFAAVGLVIVVAAAVITNFVMGSVDDAVDNAIITTTWKG